MKNEEKKNGVQKLVGLLPRLHCNIGYCIVTWWGWKVAGLRRKLYCNTGIILQEVCWLGGYSVVFQHA